MHVAICLFYNSPMGGLHLNVLDTCAKLREHNHKVTVFCPGGPFGLMLQDLGCAVRPLGSRTDLGFSFDLVHVHPGPGRKLGERLAKHLNIPLFATIHGRWFNQIEQTQEAYSHIFGVSAAICDALKKAAPCARKRISIMPNAVASVDVSEFLVSESPDYLRILVASRFAADKEVVLDVLLDLWYLQQHLGINQLYWNIAGDGKGLDRLRAFRDMPKSW